MVNGHGNYENDKHLFHFEFLQPLLQTMYQFIKLYMITNEADAADEMSIALW